MCHHHHHRHHHEQQPDYVYCRTNPADEYWIGNKALHALTSGDEEMVLRIVLSNSTEDSTYFDYKTFTVASEEQLFQLRIGNFSGMAEWDAIGKLSGQKFSTHDRDNSPNRDDCAVRFRGGWWYRNCLGGNLNGLNLNGHHESLGDGIVWEKSPIISYMLHHSYPKVQMIIRPANR
uniref:Putative ixoderin n=1 Tax=Rhipicephalus microplus TaxID=6941 RepID=A0A6M2CID2_RHIMP